MSATGTKNHLRTRLLMVAAEECQAVLKGAKTACPGLAKLALTFEDAPGPARLQRGIRQDCDYCYDPEAQELVIFLFNTYEKDHAAEDFRRRVREAVIETVEEMW